MGLQKKINKRFIKKAIGSDYIYQIEAEEKSKGGYDEEDKQSASKLKSFLQNGVNEIKKEISKKYE